MKIDLGPYRLHPDSMGIFHPAEWWRCGEPPGNLVRNHKRGLTFEIADDFTARLCGVDEGHQLPDAAICEVTAHEAIAFYQTALLPKTNNPYDDIPF